jgi:hypothetical protein
MGKYRIEFDKNEIKSIHPTEQEIPNNDTFLEEHVGDTMWAIIHADSEEQARAKAERLSQNLRNR